MITLIKTLLNIFIGRVSAVLEIEYLKQKKEKRMVLQLICSWLRFRLAKVSITTIINVKQLKETPHIYDK